MTGAMAVIPTLGNRASLWPLIEDAGMPCMVIWTGQDDPAPIGRGILRDFRNRDVTFKIDRGPIDIHRWWHAGMDLGSSRGIRTAVIVNDDVRAAPGELQKLADEVEGGTVLAYLDRPEHAAVRVTPITGWCFAVRTDRSLVPEPSPCVYAYSHPEECRHHPPALRWWYGDHEVELRARRYGPDAVKVVQGLEIEHLRGPMDYRYDREDEVLPIIRMDQKVFQRHHPELIK